MPSTWTKRDPNINNYLLSQDGSYRLHQDGSKIIYSENTDWTNRTASSAADWNIRDLPGITWATIDDTWDECTQTWAQLGSTVWINRTTI